MTSNQMIFVFLGTRAELIKVFPLLKIFQTQKVNFKIIATGQNDLTQDQLFHALKLKGRTIFLSTQKIKKTSSHLAWWWLTTLVKTIFSQQAKIKNMHRQTMIVHGDTISTLMGAIVAKLYHMTLIHLEAGLRSFDYRSPFPEEICRVLISKMANIHFAPNQWAIDNLKKAHGLIINTQQNTLIDSFYYAIKQKHHHPLINKFKKQKFFIFILHLPENLANTQFVKTIINLIIKKSTANLKCLFILHANTKFVLKQKQLIHKIEEHQYLTIVDRLQYATLMKLFHQAEFIITDGGSNQEDCYYLGQPCCLLRTKTERIEGLNHNVVLSKNNINIIENFFEHYQCYQKPALKNKISPSQIIYNSLKNLEKI